MSNIHISRPQEWTVLELLELLKDKGVIRVDSYKDEDVENFFTFSHPLDPEHITVNIREFNTRPVIEERKVSGLSDTKYTLVTDSQEIKSLKEHFGGDNMLPGDFGSALVEVLDGEYGEVWFMPGNVPYTSKTAYRIQ